MINICWTPHFMKNVLFNASIGNFMWLGGKKSYDTSCVHEW